jgi:hypothetical protein
MTSRRFVSFSIACATLVGAQLAERGAPYVYAKLFVPLNNLDTEKGRVTIPFDQVMAVSPSSQIYQTVKQHAGPIGGPVREGPVLDAYIYKMD